MSKTLPLFLLLLLSSAFAQTPSYTTSAIYGCNGSTCNGVPLDQGGTWQFIEANRAFSLDNVDPITGNVAMYIYGNPGNLATSNPQTGQAGGMYNIVDQIPAPPNLWQNGSTGAMGTLTFDWGAVNADGSHYYVGHAVVQGYRVRHFLRSPRGSGTYSTQLVLGDAQIFIIQ
jgi:hypothetical protein